MTVKELIEELSKYPDDARVWIPNRYDTDEETDLSKVSYNTKHKVVFLLEGIEP